MGFARTLLRNRTTTNDETEGANYTWGLVLQGVTKKKTRRKKKVSEGSDEGDAEAKQGENWWSCMREEVVAGVRFPTIDQPVAEALCILADLDTWHVGILSNNAPWQSSPLPVGMSRLVSNMLESFAYIWRKYHSPVHVSLFFSFYIFLPRLIDFRFNSARGKEDFSQFRTRVSVRGNSGGETEGAVVKERSPGENDDIRGGVRRQREQLDQRPRSRRGRHTATARGRDHSFSGNRATIWTHADLNTFYNCRHHAVCSLCCFVDISFVEISMRAIDNHVIDNSFDTKFLEKELTIFRT